MKQVPWLGRFGLDVSRAVRFAGVDEGQCTCAEYATVSAKADLARALMHEHQLIFVMEVGDELIGRDTAPAL